MGAVKLLLDTHTLLWALLADGDLSAKAHRAIADPDNAVFVSSASGWEITTKHRLGKLPLAENVADHLAEHIRKARFTVLDVSLDHALAAGRLPGPHKDPFDRMLIAQAGIEKLQVVSIDPVFRAYGIPVYW
jgi:PIN domain nuclease of toxin-antitoxin system